MMSLKPYKPFDFDDIFRGLVLRPVGVEQDAPHMKIDVKENEAGYVIRADIPGAKKEDIKVDIDGATVSIAAEVKREEQQKEGDRIIRSERYYGSVSRSFTLGQEVEEKTASAKYADGVLELTLPKKSGSAKRTLAIQ